MIETFAKGGHLQFNGVLYDSPEKLEAFHVGFGLNLRMGALPYLALTQLDHARLLARGGGGALEQARELAAVAAETGREIGMARSPTPPEGSSSRCGVSGRCRLSAGALEGRARGDHRGVKNRTAFAQVRSARP